ncbi:MAG: monovalent cation/H+ antiporter subunit D family protein [Pseudomonadota bacterium]
MSMGALGLDNIDMTHFPILLVMVPLFAAVFCAFLQRGILAWAIAFLASLALPFLAIAMLLHVSENGPISYALGGWAPPIGIEYRVDILSAFVLMLISIVGAVSMIYARKSVEKEIDSSRQAWFYTMYLLCLSGLLGITITNDAFNAFVFLEVSSLATYTMIALGKDRRCLVAAYQYLIMGTIGATLYVLGVGILYSVTGTLNLSDIAARLGEAFTTGGFERSILAALAMIMVGLSLKVALFPLHLWLPNAYAYAPSFATVFLAATATKVAIYLILRFFFSVFGKGLVFADLPISEILLVLSIAAMFGATFVAIFQQNIKRMLAYSSVAQVGYITLGISLANQAGLTGGIVHLFNHAIMKAALFMALGAVFYRLSSVKIDDMAGIGRVMPLTMGVFVIAGLSIVGVPGTVGFLSKFYLAQGAFDNGMGWLVFLLVASSLLSIFYIGRVVEVAWFKAPVGTAVSAQSPPASMLVPMVLLALATVYFGIETSGTVSMASQAATFLLGEVK